MFAGLLEQCDVYVYRTPSIRSHPNPTKQVIEVPTPQRTIVLYGTVSIYIGFHILFNGVWMSHIPREYEWEANRIENYLRNKTRGLMVVRAYIDLENMLVALKYKWRIIAALRGFLKYVSGDKVIYELYGTKPQGEHPIFKQVLKYFGIDVDQILSDPERRSMQFYKYTVRFRDKDVVIETYTSHKYGPVIKTEDGRIVSVYFAKLRLIHSDRYIPQLVDTIMRQAIQRDIEVHQYDMPIVIGAGDSDYTDIARKVILPRGIPLIVIAPITKMSRSWLYIKQEHYGVYALMWQPYIQQWIVVPIKRIYETAKKMKELREWLKRIRELEKTGMIVLV